MKITLPVTFLLVGTASAQIDTILEVEPLSTTGLGVQPGELVPRNLFAVDAGGTLFVRLDGSPAFVPSPAIFATEHFAFAAGDYIVGDDELVIARELAMPGFGWNLSPKRL